MDNTGFEMDPEDRAKAEESNRKRSEYQEKLALAYGEIFHSAAGQFCLKDLSERCNYNNSCIRNVNAPNATAVVFQEGKRAVFNYIMMYIRHDNERRKAR